MDARTSKALIIDELVACHRERGSDARELAQEALTPLFQNILDSIGEGDKAQELIRQFTEQVQPITFEAQRQVYDEMYSEPELYELLRFLRANPWFLQRATDQQKKVSEIVMRQVEVIMANLLRPFKYKAIKAGILQEFSIREPAECTLGELVGRLSDFPANEVTDCYHELVREGRLVVEDFNGIPHARLNT